MSIRFVALETELVRGLQTGGQDAKGQMPEHHVCAGGLMPCRHCVEDVPRANLTSFWRTDPHVESANTPRTFLKREACLIRGDSADDRIVSGTGLIVAPTFMAQTAQHILRDPRVSYTHVRSASNDCYPCRIKPACC